MSPAIQILASSDGEKWTPVAELDMSGLARANLIKFVDGDGVEPVFLNAVDVAVRARDGSL